MPKQLKIDPRKCIGCKSCELACSLKNENTFNPSVSRISNITFIEGIYSLPYNFVTTCRQCADAPCLSPCPTKAITRSKDATKVVAIDRDKCIGCGVCVRACPFGAMLFNASAKKAYKCELCGGDPACAQICPTGAIAFAGKKPFYAQPEDSQLQAYSILSERNKAGIQKKSGKENK
jgi:anaerobic carbon-monoxide dehydrogenase iron sulfur subunit